MSAKLTKTLLSLALLGFLIPAAGCDLRKSGSSSGSYSVSDVLFDFAWFPTSSTYDTVEYYEEETYYDSGYSSGGCYDCGYSSGSDYYYEDDYYGDYYYYEDDYYGDGDYWWKKKRADKRR